MAHQLTPVQRKVLGWIRDAEGMVTVETGHKKTTLVEGDFDDQILLCQTLVPYFLKHHGYIESVGIRRVCLTDKGWRVAKQLAKNQQ